MLLNARSCMRRYVICKSIIYVNCTRHIQYFAIYRTIHYILNFDIPHHTGVSAEDGMIINL